MVAACGDGAPAEEAGDTSDLTSGAKALAGVYAAPPSEAREGALFELRLHGESGTFSLAAMGRIQCGKPGYACGKEQRPRWGGSVDVTRIGGRWTASAAKVTLKPRSASGGEGPPMSLDIVSHGVALDVTRGTYGVSGVLDALALEAAAHEVTVQELDGRWKVISEVTHFDASERAEYARTMVGYDAVAAHRAAHVVTFSAGKVSEEIGSTSRKGEVRVGGGPRAEVDAYGATPGVLSFTLADGRWSVVRIQSLSGQKLKMSIVNPLDRNDETWWELERAP